MGSAGQIGGGPLSDNVCHVYQTATYSNTTETDFSFNTNPLNSAWWVVGSPTKVTVPHTGLYLIQSDFTLSHSNNFAAIAMRVNGTTIAYVCATESTVSYRFTYAVVMQLTANDYLTWRVDIGSGYAGTYTVNGYSTTDNVNYYNRVNNSASIYTAINTAKSFSVCVQLIAGNS